MRLVCGDALYPYLPQIAVLMQRHLPGIDPTGAQAIAVVDERVRAVVLYDQCTGANIHMHIASDDPKWCSRKMLRGLFGYPFHQLQVRRVTAMTAKGNKHARRFLERLGFRLEGVHPESLEDGGALCSYGMLKRDCRWIDDGQENPQSAKAA